jgi:hypothetical protein
VKPQRELHPVEILLVLERGDGHPDDREERDHEEEREPGIDKRQPEPPSR